MFLSKSQILGVDDKEYIDVEVKEWGGTIRVSTIAASEKTKYESALFDFMPDGTRRTNKDALEKLQLRVIAAAIVDDKGERLFDTKDLAALGEKSSKVINKLFKIVSEHNGIDSEDEAEAEKN